MQVLINSDHHISGGEDLTERVRGVVEGRLERFEGRTRGEVHLSGFPKRWTTWPKGPCGPVAR